MSWSEKNNKLVKEFKLKSFSDLMSRMVAIGEVADRMDHHPDFSVFGYKNIRFELCTHSKGKVTDKDYALAKEIDAILTKKSI